MFNKQTKPQNRIDSLIGATTRIEGNVVFSGGLRVDGTIHGPVHATESLELQAGSRVKGDVYYKRIEIHQGAVVEGRLVHHGAEVKSVELKLASGA